MGVAVISADARQAARQLRAAKSRIITPETWNQGCAAVDRSGEECFAWSKRAHRRCTWGAIAADENNTAAAFRYFRAANPDIDRFADWNDHPERTHDEVMAAFDRAIAFAEAEAA